MHVSSFVKFTAEIRISRSLKIAFSVTYENMLKLEIRYATETFGGRISKQHVFYFNLDKILKLRKIMFQG